VNNIIDYYATKQEKIDIKKLPNNDDKTKEFIARYSAILLHRFKLIEDANQLTELKVAELKKEFGI
jgi:hypothetical protein